MWPKRQFHFESFGLFDKSLLHNQKSSDNVDELIPFSDARSTATLRWLSWQIKGPRSRSVRNFRAIFEGFDWLQKAVMCGG